MTLLFSVNNNNNKSSTANSINHQRHQTRRYFPAQKFIKHIIFRNTQKLRHLVFGNHLDTQPVLVLVLKPPNNKSVTVHNMMRCPVDRANLTNEPFSRRRRRRFEGHRRHTNTHRYYEQYRRIHTHTCVTHTHTHRVFMRVRVFACAYDRKPSKSIG